MEAYGNIDNNKIIFLNKALKRVVMWSWKRSEQNIPAFKNAI